MGNDTPLSSSAHSSSDEGIRVGETGDREGAEDGGRGDGAAAGGDDASVGSDSCASA